MLKKYFPYEHVKSVFNIDYKKLYSLGFKGIIFDIDNTLVLHGADSNPQVDALFSYLHDIGFKTLLLSNNDEERIKRFIKNIDTLYISDADKPKVDNYYKAVEMLGFEKSETVVIGDQLFTDIYGANKSGIPNILVDFLRRENETNFGKKRLLEKYILKFYGKCKKKNSIGNIYSERGCF